MYYDENLFGIFFHPNFAAEIKQFCRMEKSIFILVNLIVVVFIAAASDAPIQLKKKGQIGNHFEFPVPADQPNVYYNDENQEIIIDGYAVVNYYDVEIASWSTGAVMISTSVDGDYDTIDISSLPTDDYVITIDTPLNNTFTGYFHID